jgi:bacterial/archaeal transporter family-2 protein
LNTASYMIVAIVLGALVTVQPLLNAILARSIGSPFGATTVVIGVACLIGVVFIAVLGNGGEINVRTLTNVPWWVYLTSLIGVLYIAGGVVIAPVTGAFLFFVCIIGGQLIGSAVMDHLGAFGLPVREISIKRLVGLALVLGGAILVSKG